jgi:hypothetical protein
VERTVVDTIHLVKEMAEIKEEPERDGNNTLVRAKLA